MAAAEDSETAPAFVTQKYNSYSEFQLCLNDYMTENYCVFRKKHSESVEKSNTKTKHKIKEKFVYSRCVFICTHYGQPRLRGRGIVTKTKHSATGCEVSFTLNYDYFDKVLKVTKFYLEHNHPTTPETYAKEYKVKRLKTLEKQDSREIVHLNPNNENLQHTVNAKYNESFNLSDNRRMKSQSVMESPILIPDWPKEWPCQKWTFQSLAELLQDKELSCRIWKKSKVQTFETSCDHLHINMSHFCDWFDEKASPDNPLFPFPRTDYNCYIDYKYMTDMFSSVPEVFNDVRWCDFGLNDFNGRHSTIWIGTEGSNTPCHQDSYGFNLVTQIQGSKMWILFPPSDATYLHPTRIPYEESSLFSQVDVKNPDLYEYPNFQHSHPTVVVLKPGQSLYVPHLWWHYVESLEPSISINVWVPMEQDDDQRLKEALTRCLASSLITNQVFDEHSDLESQLLNPTEHLYPSSTNQILLKSALERVLHSHQEEENQKESEQIGDCSNRNENDDEKSDVSILEGHENGSHFKKFERWIQNSCEVVQNTSPTSLFSLKRSTEAVVLPHRTKKFKGDLESQVKCPESSISCKAIKIYSDDHNLTMLQENVLQGEQGDSVVAEIQDSCDQNKTKSAFYESSKSHNAHRKKELHVENPCNSFCLNPCDISLTKRSFNIQKHKIYYPTAFPFNEYLSVISSVCHQMKSKIQDSSLNFVKKKCSNEKVNTHNEEMSGSCKFALPVTVQKLAKCPNDEDNVEDYTEPDLPTQSSHAESEAVAQDHESLLTESEFLKTFIASVLHPDVITQISLVLKESHLRNLRKQRIKKK